MSVVVVENLAKSFGEVEIFSDISFRLEEKDKVGFVGNNGEGKTTLIKCLLGLEEYDRGRINFQFGLTVGYAAQQGVIEGATLWEQLTLSHKDVSAIQEQINNVEKVISSETDESVVKQLLQQYSSLQAKYEHAGGYVYEREARKIAFGLGFTEEDFMCPIAEFSGGQKTRVLLASALLGKPDLLILDEPTNHLDINMTEWLENYLIDYSGAIFLVSHDRYFLDRIVNRVFLLQKGKLKAYKGNYSHYIRQKTEQDMALSSAYEKQQEHIKKTEDYIRKYKAGIKSKQARGRQSQLDRLERIDAPVVFKDFGLRLPKPQESAEKVLLCEDLTIGYCEKPLLKDLTLLLRQSEKVALIGNNGVGKTTFLKTITKQLPTLKGVANLGNRVKIGYFSQEHINLFGKETLLEILMQDLLMTEEQARNLLGGMLFQGDDVFKRLDDLSGGERARMALLKLVLEGANFLILDEPTNHLDINAREIVEEALVNWQGSLLVVSHDRYFLDKIANRVWEIEQGKLVDYLGNYSYFRAKKQELLEKELEKEALLPKAKVVNKIEQKNVEVKKTKKSNPQNVTKRLASLELSIREQEALLKVLELRMSDPNEHIDVTASSNLAKEYQKIKEHVDELLLEWESIVLAQEDE